ASTNLVSERGGRLHGDRRWSPFQTFCKPISSRGCMTPPPEQVDEPGGVACANAGNDMGRASANNPAQYLPTRATKPSRGLAIRLAQGKKGRASARARPPGSVASRLRGRGLPVWSLLRCPLTVF